MSKSPKFPTKYLIGTLLLVLIVIMAGLSYLVFEQQTTIKQLSQKITEQEAKLQEKNKDFLDTIKDKLGEFGSLKEDLNTQAKKAQDFFSKQQTNIEASIDKVLELSKQGDWAILEIKFLLFLASERLAALDDVTGAINTLKSVDQKLVALNDPRFIGLRQAITFDIAKLQEHAKAKQLVQDTWLKLSQIQKQVAELTPIFQQNQDQVAKDQTEQNSSDKEQAKWQAMLNNAWSEFKQIVKIQKFDTTKHNEVLTLEDQMQVKRGLFAILEQAKWALMQGNYFVYRENLTTFNTWLENYFIDNAKAQNIAKQIDHLKTTDFATNQELNINQSINAFEKIQEALKASEAKQEKQESQEANQ